MSTMYLLYFLLVSLLPAKTGIRMCLYVVSATRMLNYQLFALFHKWLAPIS
jgi:hypothetical protein